MSFVNTSLPFPFTDDLVKARRRRRPSNDNVQDAQQKRRELDEAERQKEQDVFSRLVPVPPSLQRSRVTRQQFEAREAQRANIRNSNLRLLATIGVRPQAGGLQRTASDIIEGKSNVPLSQVSASVQRQVELERLNRSLASGNLKITADELRDIRAGIAEDAAAKAAEEREFRSFRSARKARGEAAKFEEQRLIALDQSQRQNKLSQIRATGRQNQKVLDTLETLGATTELTRATPRRIDRITNNESQRSFALQQVERPITESRGVLTSKQINAGDIQTVDPLDSVRPDRQNNVLNDFFDTKSRIPVSEELLVENQGPSRRIDTVAPVIGSNLFGFSVQGEFPTGEPKEAPKQSFTGTREDFFRQRTISQVAKNVSEFGDKVDDPFRKFLAGATEETIGIGTSLVNLGRFGINAAAEAVTGKKRPTEPQLFVAPTVTGEFTGGVVEGVGKAFQSGKPSDFFGGIQEGAKRADTLRKEQGDARAAGQLIAFAAPVAPGLRKVNPIRIDPIVLPLKSGERRVATTVTAFGKPIATKQGSTIKRGSVKSEVLPLDEISPTGRGFEIGTGTSKTAQKAKIEIADELSRRGLLAPNELAKIKTVNEIVQLGSTAKRRTFRSDFGSNPFTELSPGRQTTAQLDFFRKERLPPITGSFSQIPQVLPKFARRAGDFDIKIGDIAKGAQLARRNVSVLQPTANPLEEFIAVKAKVKKVTPKGETKVGEFLTKEDELIGDGQGVTLDSVFGIKPDTKPIKVSGIKVTTLRDQLLRKASTVSALQGPESSGIIKTRLNVGPPDFRKKDITDLFAIGKTQAFVLKESGKTKQAAQLDIASERLKKLFPDIDFDAPFAKGQTVEFGIKEPSILSGIVSKSAKRSVVPKTSNDSSLSSGIQVKDSSSLPSVKIRDSISSVSSKSAVSSIGNSLQPRVSTSISSKGRSSRNVSSIESFVPSTISIGSQSLSKSSLSKSVSSRSLSSRSISTRSPTTIFGEGVNFKEPRIKLGLFGLKLKDKAKLDDERVTGIGIKQFRTGTADPLAPGVIAAFGVKQRISKSSKVFRKLDKALIKSRKRRGRFGVFDVDKPFGVDLKF